MYTPAAIPTSMSTASSETHGDIYVSRRTLPHAGPQDVDGFEALEADDEGGRWYTRVEDDDD